MGKTEIVSELLRLQADVNIKAGHTPLQTALNDDYEEGIEMLIKSNATTDSLNKQQHAKYKKYKIRLGLEPPENEPLKEEIKKPRRKSTSRRESRKPLKLTVSASISNCNNASGNRKRSPSTPVSPGRNKLVSSKSVSGQTVRSSIEDSELPKKSKSRSPRHRAHTSITRSTNPLHHSHSALKSEKTTSDVIESTQSSPRSKSTSRSRARANDITSIKSPRSSGARRRIKSKLTPQVVEQPDPTPDFKPVLDQTPEPFEQSWVVEEKIPPAMETTVQDSSLEKQSSETSANEASEETSESHSPVIAEEKILFEEIRALFEKMASQSQEPTEQKALTKSQSGIRFSPGIAQGRRREALKPTKPCFLGAHKQKSAPIVFDREAVCQSGVDVSVIPFQQRLNHARAVFEKSPSESTNLQLLNDKKRKNPN